MSRRIKGATPHIYPPPRKGRQKSGTPQLSPLFVLEKSPLLLRLFRDRKVTGANRRNVIIRQTTGISVSVGAAPPPMLALLSLAHWFVYNSVFVFVFVFSLCFCFVFSRRHLEKKKKKVNNKTSSWRLEYHSCHRSGSVLTNTVPGEHTTVSKAFLSWEGRHKKTQTATEITPFKPHTAADGCIHAFPCMSQWYKSTKKVWLSRYNCFCFCLVLAGLSIFDSVVGVSSGYHRRVILCSPSCRLRDQTTVGLNILRVRRASG